MFALEAVHIYFSFTKPAATHSNSGQEPTGHQQQAEKDAHGEAALPKHSIEAGEHRIEARLPSGKYNINISIWSLLMWHFEKWHIWLNFNRNLLNAAPGNHAVQ